MLKLRIYIKGLFVIQQKETDSHSSSNTYLTSTTNTCAAHLQSNDFFLPSKNNTACVFGFEPFFVIYDIHVFEDVVWEIEFYSPFYDVIVKSTFYGHSYL